MGERDRYLKQLTMVVTECLVDGSQDGFSHLLSPVQVVVTVGEDLIKTNKKMKNRYNVRDW